MLDQTNCAASPASADSTGTAHASVAAYFTECVDRLRDEGVRQADIAERAGFTSPNIITMIKQGRTKLPIGRVSAIAKALEVDAVYLFNLTMAEYEPDTWRDIQAVYASPLIPTLAERRLLEALRESGVRLDQMAETDRSALARRVAAAL